MRCIFYCVIVLFFTILYCEFLADYWVLQNCEWPQMKDTHTESDSDDVVHAMILADTHLLGPHRGHWLDKFYREWHMHIAFQAAVRLFRPDIIFVLGDIFDEGELVSDSHFVNYVNRYARLFRVPAEVPLISLVGNHDVGFHYKMHPYFTSRFDIHFTNNTRANMYTFRGVHFVVINSMAMENDGCFYCTEAIDNLQAINETLECMKNSQPERLCDYNRYPYSRPVLLQHFPTYRISDEVCREYDIPVIEQYRENWEVLSKQATDFLGETIKPRLAFAGHIHHYCHSINRFGIDEYTVASFNWRNKVNPSFMLARITPQEYAVAKCDMLHQQTVYNSYIVAFEISIFLVMSAL